MKKIRVGVLGATGYVGQRFITLLENHPYFEVVVVAASSRSAGQRYVDCINNIWKIKEKIPDYVKNMVLKDVYQIDDIAKEVSLIFIAVAMDKEEIKKLEEAYAKKEVVVISNNSVHRFTKDVPVVIPEINSKHFEIIKKQQARLETKKGFIVCKPNCSIQCYVPLIDALKEYQPYLINVSTYQAISGAGKTFETFKEIDDNIIPYIKGEEEKSEQEPLKIWGSINNNEIVLNEDIKISAQCLRVPVSEGHMATVSVKFKKKPTKEEIINKWNNYPNIPFDLPSKTEKFITYFEDDSRPQTKIDRDLENGMGISVGRLREDSIFDYKFIGLSHNTIRGAAGGAILTAELLYKMGYIK